MCTCKASKCKFSRYISRYKISKIKISKTRSADEATIVWNSFSPEKNYLKNVVGGGPRPGCKVGPSSVAVHDHPRRFQFTAENVLTDTILLPFCRADMSS